MHKHSYHGTCHCENISVAFRTEKAEADLAPRECSCSFCQRHQGRYISDPKGSLEIAIKDKSLMNRYRFGHKTADFIICKNCGTFMAAVCEIDGRDHAVLNIRTMPDHNFTGDAGHNDYDAENKESRLERRAKNWIGNVKFR